GPRRRLLRHGRLVRVRPPRRVAGDRRAAPLPSRARLRRHHGGPGLLLPPPDRRRHRRARPAPRGGAGGAAEGRGLDGATRAARGQRADHGDGARVAVPAGAQASRVAGSEASSPRRRSNAIARLAPAAAIRITATRVSATLDGDGSKGRELSANMPPRTPSRTGTRKRPSDRRGRGSGSMPAIIGARPGPGYDPVGGGRPAAVTSPRARARPAGPGWPPACGAPRRRAGGGPRAAQARP